ncbi:hypothetical protein CHARACLAT_032709 [Characodon lateralis]|uniref:Uncharacterized protein n=1 Tax=Characodon lateralis TaxID=208331 RepID=A0ABU7F7Y0_9TELE|nr:hypothetical protein [Characodon lateralis]
MSFGLRNLSIDQLSSVQSVLSLPLLQTPGPVSCLHSGDHLHSSKNITNRTNEAQQFILHFCLCPTPCSLPTDSASQTSCARQPACSPTLPTDLQTWTPGVNLPGTNLCIDDRTSQPSSLSSTVSPLLFLHKVNDLHNSSSSLANPDCPSQSSRFHPQPVTIPDSSQPIK